jgi:hypothetical protein
MKKIFFVLLGLLIVFPGFAQTRNADNPLKGTWDFQLQKVWKIEGAGDDVFAEIRDIITSGSGRIFVADGKHVKIYILDKEGKFISSFGKSGEGPGEFRNFRMGSRLHLLNDCLMVNESNRIHYFTLDGEFVRTESLPNLMDARAFVSADEFISAPTVIENPNLKKAEVKLVNISDHSEKKIATYQPFEKAVQRQETSEGSTVIAIVLGGITPMMMVEYRDGKIYFGMSDQYKIDVVNLAGKPIGGFYLEGRKPNPVSEKYKNDLLKRLSSQGGAPESMLKNIVDGLPRDASYFENIVVDKNGLIYVFVANPGEDSKKSIDIFSPRGQYLYSSTISVPDGCSIRRVYLKDDLLIMAVEDDEGAISLNKYTIRIPSA